MIKKIIALTLSLTTIFSAAAGCNSKSEDDQNTLTVNIMANRATEFCDAMVKKFPDINFDFNYYYGENMSGYLGNSIRNGDASDLIYYTQISRQESLVENFLDLSGYPFIGNLSDDILSVLNVDDHIYQIPAPLEVRCIIYNKTLFAENGWKIPANFNELLDVVKQIRKESPDITPIAMSLGGAAYPFLAAGTLSQCGFLSTIDGFKWEQDFMAGKASFADGFDEGLTIMEQLIDANAFDTEPYVGKWNCNEQMIKREAAMEFHWANMLSFMQTITSDEVTDEFGFLPFYGLNDGDKLVGFSSSLTWSVNKKLADKGNEKKLENALRVMEWITTEEAQTALSSNQGQYPVIDNMKNELIDTYMEELWELSKNGYKASGLYTGYEHIIIDVTKPIQEAMENDDSTGMREAAIEIADRLNQKFLVGDTSECHGELSENLSEAETAQFQADAINSAGIGDFALITHSGRKGDVINTRGAAGTLYTGKISQEELRIILSDADSFVYTMELTGEEIKNLLENGKEMFTDEYKIIDFNAEMPENIDELEKQSFEYYWSGIDVEFKNGKVSSIKLDGNELDNSTKYTVAFQSLDYPASLWDRAIESEITMDSVMVDYIKANTPVTAPVVLRK